MRVKLWMYTVLLGIVTLSPLGLFLYFNDPINKPISDVNRPVATIRSENKILKPLKVDDEFEVKACKVIDGYRFEMYLEGDNWISAHLATATKESATLAVTEIMNKTNSISPSVILKRQIGDHWIVDFYLSVDGKKTNMVDVLRAKGLLL